MQIDSEKVDFIHIKYINELIYHAHSMAATIDMYELEVQILEIF